MNTPTLEQSLVAPVTGWLATGQLMNGGTYSRAINPGEQVYPSEGYELIRRIDGVEYVSTLAGRWPLSEHQHTDERR